MKKLYDIRDFLDGTEWSVCGTGSDCSGQSWAEIGAYSPEGEDFIFTVWFDGSASDFIDKVRDYAEDYDADDHAAELIEFRGQNGIPNSIRAIIDDAEAIGDMLNDLWKTLGDWYAHADDLDEEWVRENWEEALAGPSGYGDIASSIGWGFTREDLETLKELHKAGKFREKIEDLLDDCNFHTESGNWHDGNYIIRED